MKVLVIGASGLTGSRIVTRLLARGDDVTAFARSTASITTKHDKLRIAEGEARDLASLERACEGQDAVVAAFGPRSTKKDDLQEVFMRNILAAMEKAGVKRFVNLSAWGAGDSDRHTVFVFKIIRALFLQNLFDDKNRGELLLVQSKLDWINVRPGRLTNGATRGGVKASLEPKGIKPFLTRDDLADFMVAQLDDATWIRKSPLIGY